MPYDADIIVVGSGAGGATFAHACARAGKRVLLLERGPRHAPEPCHDERSALIDKKPYDDRLIEVNGRVRRLYMGGGLGGSTALYGAALMRPSRDDFHPGKTYPGKNGGDSLPRALWDWPIPYETLEPFYSEAEALFGVAGCDADDFSWLPKPAQGFPLQPLPVHPINQRLMHVNSKHGLRPFRLPLAIDRARCLQCHACPGYLCPNGARRSSAQLLDTSAQDTLHVLTSVEAEKLSVDGKGDPDGIAAVDRCTGRRDVYRARRYVLAAGAIGSPLLLLRSGMTHPLIGRNYMMHFSPVVIGIFADRLNGHEGFIKQVGFADYYFGTRNYPHKMGLVQSLPVPGPLLLQKAASRWLPRTCLDVLRAHMLPLVGMIEDLPNPVNRVYWGSHGQPCLRHRFAPYDLERGKRLARLTARILRRAGAAFCLASHFASEEHVAHQCGTLRFGTDPAHAVLDPDCRMFGHPNVFVVDGSFMPTSLGVGPALTIMANALRVARIVAREV
jgi:choline dehydrogenase-like flavoprotein